MIWIYLLTLLFGVGRFFIPGHNVSLPGTYEAFAHIWCGVLIGLAFAPGTTKQMKHTSLWLLLAITAIETVKFFTR